MVIQRDVPIHVWGWAVPGETVNVTMGNLSATCKADAEGKWSVSLPKQPASSNPQAMTVKGSSGEVTVKDILIGDVWVCSGQSNMALPVSGMSCAATELPQANRPGMRFFQVKSGGAPKPQADCEGQWAVCSPDSAKGFSAVGYFFGKAIEESQKVPVGLIGSNQGASSAQPWVSLEALNGDPDLKKSYIEPVASVLADPDSAKVAHDKWLAEVGDQYNKERAKWNQDAYTASQKKEPFSRPRPTPPASPEPPFFTASTTFPSVLFNGKIHPLVQYPIKGALWYQGESNGPFYGKLVSALIKDWRTRWGVGDFPFLIVQLPNKSKQQKDPQDFAAGWAPIRETQLRIAQTVPNTGIVSSIDLGATEDPVENNNLHPMEKGNIGQRLALVARHYAYGENNVYSGPIFDKFKVEGGKVRITFTQIAQGLKIGTPPKDSLTPKPATDELKGFIIAGEDKKFVWAKATIEGQNTVVVWSDSVKNPQVVRYGWHMSPVVNLYNSADLPAFPFRTDTDAQ